MKIQKLTVIILLFVLSGCKNSYQALLKSPNVALKYEKAVEFFQEGKFEKAQPLLEELLSVTRGTTKAEDVYYYYAYTDYKLKNYQLAAYNFKNFATSFPSSKRAEEMEYMYAYSLALESPTAELDQTSTLKAIEAFQLFVNKYSSSDRIQNCNDEIDRLRKKLELKAYNNAKLFYQMEDFRAAMVAFQNTLRNFPDIEQREEIAFLIVKSSYKLANNSIPEKEIVRYEETIRQYNGFKEEFPKSKYLKDAEKFAENAKKNILAKNKSALVK